MQKNWMYCTALVAVLCLNSTISAGDTLADIKAKGLLACGVKESTPGFGSIDPKTRDLVGHDVDLCRAIADKIGVQVELKPVTSATRIPELVAGNVDIVAATMTKTADRAQQIDFSYTYFLTGQKFLVRKGTVPGLADLAGKRIGVDKASTSEHNAKKAIPTAIILAFDDYPQGMLALRRGKIAAVSTDEVILANLLAQAPDKDDYEILDIRISDEPYGLGIRKNETNLLNAVNKILLEMEQTGEARLLFDKWFGPDSPSPMQRGNFKIIAAKDPWEP